MNDLQKIPNFMEGYPVGADLFHVDGTDTQTDGRTERQTDIHNNSYSRFLKFLEHAWKYDVGNMITSKCSLESLWKAAVLAKLRLLYRQLPELTEVNSEYNS